MAQLNTNQIGIYKDNNWYVINPYTKDEVDSKVSSLSNRIQTLEDKPSDGYLFAGTCYMDQGIVYTGTLKSNYHYISSLTVNKTSGSFIIEAKIINVESLSLYRDMLQVTPQLFSWPSSDENAFTAICRFASMSGNNIAWNVWMYNVVGSGGLRNNSGISFFLPNLEN